MFRGTHVGGKTVKKNSQEFTVKFRRVVMFRNQGGECEPGGNVGLGADSRLG